MDEHQNQSEAHINELYNRCMDKFFVNTVPPFINSDSASVIGVDTETYLAHITDVQNIHYGWGLLNTAFTLRIPPKQFTDFMVSEGILFRGDNNHLYPCWGYINWFDMVPAYDKKYGNFYLRPVINKLGMPPILLTLMKAGLITEQV